MKLRARVFAFTLLSGIVASVLLLFLQVVAQESRQELLRSLQAPGGLAAFGFILIAYVLPATLPLTLVGGCIAARVAGKQQHRQPLRYWITRGCAYGLILGALGTAVLYGGSNEAYIWYASRSAAPTHMIGPSQQEMLYVVFIMGRLGGEVGLLVGVSVGLYCWHLVRRWPPNPPLNPTGAEHAPAG
jgi:hypothetical protein